MNIKKTLYWWTVFAVSTYALSKVFEASRQITQSSQGGSLVELGAWGSLLLLSFLILGYDSYQKSKAEGKVIHPIWFFEKFNQFKHREKNQ